MWQQWRAGRFTGAQLLTIGGARRDAQGLEGVRTLLENTRELAVIPDDATVHFEGSLAEGFGCGDASPPGNGSGFALGEAAAVPPVRAICCADTYPGFGTFPVGGALRITTVIGCLVSLNRLTCSGAVPPAGYPAGPL